MPGHKASGPRHQVARLQDGSLLLYATFQPGHVRIAIKAVGICATDIHFLKHGRIGDFVVREPMVIGHESSGVVHAVGEGVTQLKV